ncbi:MAG: hypothetical protein CME67_01635 [Halobacteriovoraceae bacterium]|nr:hypothetical protein [Peredibacter sp.]MBI99904.1 hypothetical protein [Halobacteriovoraceae bacterium]|tara:strand:- start:1145 stop:1630 length:486 start_codon:yes stop_codon:yes gene_type:complete
MSNEFKFNIGDSVYSPKFGLGKVLTVDFMEGADTHFYVIESFVNHTKLMVPVEASKKQLRWVATKEEVSKMLGVFSRPVEEQVFESKKDRVKFFKTQQKNVVLKERVAALAQLHSIKDKGKVEKEIFQKMLEDISNEFSHVLKLSETEVNSTIVQNLSNVA